jgi:hypothetical protein
VTIANNVADSDNNGSGNGGGIFIFSGTVNLLNTIVTGNTDRGGQAPDCSGTITSLGHNLIQSTAGCTITGDTTGNILGQDPRLGPLADNGGPTFTHALLPGSPAIDTASSQNAPSTDQRGVARPQGAGFDIGAFEFQATTTATDTATSLHASTNSPNFGEPLVITAIVTSNSESGTPGGNVVFTVDGQAQPPVQLMLVNGINEAIFSTSSLSVGQHTIGASYTGGPGFNGSPAEPLTLTIVAASTPPTVVGVQRFGYHTQPTVLVLSFSTALDPSSVENTNNYHIAPFYALRLRGPHQSPNIPVARAVYNAETDQVLLYPAQRLALHRAYALTVTGTPPGGLRSAAGVFLDGNGSGVPGTNYEALITKQLLAGRSDQVPGSGLSNAVASRHRLSAAAVDVLAASGRLKVANHAISARSVTSRHAR